MNTQEDAGSYPESVAYERQDRDGTIRVEFSMAIGSHAKLVLEAYAPPNDAPKLPVPQADFDLTQRGVHGRLFEMPGTRLTDERLTWEQRNFAAQGSRDARGHPGWDPVDVPTRTFTYRFTTKVSPADALSAWQAALKQAGWKWASETTSPLFGAISMRYELPGRRALEAALTATQVNGTAQLTAGVSDPRLWTAILPQLRLMQQESTWEIAPDFDAQGRPTEQSRLKLFAFSSRTYPRTGETLLIIPIVEPALSRNASAAAQAQAASRWVREEMLRVGIGVAYDERQPTDFSIYPGIKSPLLPKFGVAVGTRVTRQHCVTVTDRRPDSVAKRCECKVDNELLSSREGECRK